MLMSPDKMLCSRQLFIFLVSVAIDSLKAESVRTATFNKVIGTNPGMGPLGAGWPESTMMKCAVACVQLYGRCHAFTYNETSALCTLGHSVASTSPYSLQPPDGSLYASTVCDVNAGFAIYSELSVTSCLWISTFTADFSEAQQSCEDKGANLVTTQTEEKLDIVLMIAEAMHLTFWIGADDRLVYDEFRWHDDGSVMTNAQREAVFQTDITGEPNNLGNVEHCVQYSAYFERINDVDCTFSHVYICETDPTFH